jgi:hypothetical protein
VYHRVEHNHGAAWNFNNVFRLSAGPYFKWAAADDLHRPSFVRSCLDVMEEEPGVVLAYTQVVDIDEKEQVLCHWGSRPRAIADDPVERFRDVIDNEDRAFPVFGLVRSDSLRRTSLIGGYSGSDYTLLAELALLGRFHEAPWELFCHREHAGRSTRVHPDMKHRAGWFDTRRAGKVTCPHWSLGRSYFRAAARLTDRPIARRKAMSAAAAWTGVHWRDLRHEAKWWATSRIPFPTAG